MTASSYEQALRLELGLHHYFVDGSWKKVKPVSPVQSTISTFGKDNAKTSCISSR